MALDHDRDPHPGMSATSADSLALPPLAAHTTLFRRQHVIPDAPAPVPLTGITTTEALALLKSEGEETERWFDLASRTRDHYTGNEIAFCGIINAKAGKCADTCKFCAQSIAWRGKAQTPEYPLKPVDEIVARARKVQSMGGRAFSMVMAVPRLKNRSDIRIIAEATRIIAYDLGMEVCGSLGRCKPAVMRTLREAGMVRYHHNLETARSHHRNIVDSYDFQESVDTIRAAKDAGMHVCSGGIYGMGESLEQRVEMADELRQLGVESVPINFLNARPGTPLFGLPKMTADEALKSLAMLRLMMPDRDILIAGGRVHILGDQQSRIFRAGANGMMVGNYLTTANQPWDEDRALAEDQGFTIRPARLAPIHSREEAKSLVAPIYADD